MPYVTSQGAKIYWDEQGSGPPVLLIMGLSFSHEMWFRILPLLRERYRTIYFDNRGMGRSDVTRGPYRIQLMADDAAAVLNAAGVAAAHVIGASMGGMIAQELALRHPQRVLSLILGCTSYGGVLARWPILSEIPRAIPLRGAALERLLYAKTTARDRMEEDWRIQAQCQWSPRGFWGQFGGILLWNSYLRLPRIKVPSLVVHGDEDRLIPPVNGRVVARRIPGSRFELISGAGHMLLTDQFETSVALMERFLDEQSLGR